VIRDANSSGFLLEVAGEEAPICAVRFFTYGREQGESRGFRIVYPKKRPYTPTQSELELGQLAKTGVADAAEFTIHQSKRPEPGPKGGLWLPFGKDVFVVSSVKNFMVEDENKRVIFALFKTSGLTCTLKVKEPMTPLVAFAVAVAAL
jgi:hypothetical protein